MSTAGNNRSQDLASAASIQEGHMANIKRLYYEGKLKVREPLAMKVNGWVFLFSTAPVKKKWKNYW